MFGYHAKDQQGVLPRMACYFFYGSHQALLLRAINSISCVGKGQKEQPLLVLDFRPTLAAQPESTCRTSTTSTRSKGEDLVLSYSSSSGVTNPGPIQPNHNKILHLGAQLTCLLLPSSCSTIRSCGSQGVLLVQPHSPNAG